MHAQHYWSVPHADLKRVHSTARLADHRFFVMRARGRRRDRRRLMPMEGGDGNGGEGEPRARTCSSLITLD